MSGVTTLAQIPLGAYVKDKISGFEGVVFGRTEWLYSCIRYMVASTELDKDGKVQDLQAFDEGQLEIIPDPRAVKPPVVEPEAPKKLTGGPRDQETAAPRNTSYESRGGLRPRQS